MYNDVVLNESKGFSVLGLDYSSAGIERQNPDVINDLMLGDLYDSIDNLISSESCSTSPIWIICCNMLPTQKPYFSKCIAYWNVSASQS